MRGNVHATQSRTRSSNGGTPSFTEIQPVETGAASSFMLSPSWFRSSLVRSVQKDGAGKGEQIVLRRRTAPIRMPCAPPTDDSIHHL
jgi:hypothetical protein